MLSIVTTWQVAGSRGTPAPAPAAAPADRVAALSARVGDRTVATVVLAISEEPAGSMPATPSPVLARGALSR